MGFLEGDVRIANLALTAMGAKTILSFDAGSEEADVMNLLYDHVRDEELEANPWVFAMARAQLSEDTSSPAFEWANQFLLPADCLRPWALWNPVVSPYFAVEGSLLLTDEATCYLRYIKRQTDTTKFSNLFVAAFYTKLAMKASTRLTSSRTKLSDLATLYTQAIGMAKVTNAILDLPHPDPLNSEDNYSWIKR